MFGCKKKISVNSAFLKHIAYLSMFVDHFFAVVFMEYMLWRVDQGFFVDEATKVYHMGRAVGRIAFVLFAFMAAEGFCHTHSRKKYLIRLGAFALLSEIPFDLALQGKLFDLQDQNVYFTLFFGVLALYLLETLHGHILLQAAGVAICCAAALFLKSDYMFMGVLLIVVFYLFRGSFWLQFLGGSIVLYFGIVLIYMVRYWGTYIPLATFFNSGLSELYGIFAFVPIYLYNGEKGKQLPKAFYYLFYPLHLLLLYGLKIVLFTL